MKRGELQTSILTAVRATGLPRDLEMWSLRKMIWNLTERHLQPYGGKSSSKEFKLGSAFHTLLPQDHNTKWTYPEVNLKLRFSEAWASCWFLALSTVSESEGLKGSRAKMHFLQTHRALNESIGRRHTTRTRTRVFTCNWDPLSSEIPTDTVLGLLFPLRLLHSEAQLLFWMHLLWKLPVYLDFKCCIWNWKKMFLEAYFLHTMTIKPIILLGQVNFQRYKVSMGGISFFQDRLHRFNFGPI